MTDYESRLLLPIVNKIPTVYLYSKSGERLATSYARIVIGGRGPYVEFLPTTIDWFNFQIPTDLIWKIESDSVDYVEYRSNKDHVKLYLQKREVSYATYKIGFVYISPFELYFDPTGLGNYTPLITPLKKK